MTVLLHNAIEMKPIANRNCCVQDLGSDPNCTLISIHHIQMVLQLTIGARPSANA